MPGTKDELRAEVATLREELAAERAKVEVLREQLAAHTCLAGWHYHPYPSLGAAPQPWYVTYGGTTSVPLTSTTAGSLS